MELRHLRYFVAVAEELSFTKAADKMCTVQPSLSQQIKDLEDEIGVKLLLRSNRKVELTAEGEAFLEEALLSLEHAQRAVTAARNVAKNNQQRLNIGFLPVAEMKIFPYIMPNIRAHFPDLNINFQSLTDAEQLIALKAGNIDIAFTRYQDNSDDIESIYIFREPLVLIIPKDSAEAKLPEINIRSFDQQDFIISDENASPELTRLIRNFFKSKKLTPNIVQYSNNILLNVNLVSMGVGWSLVPLYVTPLLGDKIIVKSTTQPLPEIDLYVSFRKKDKNKAIHLILDILKEHFFVDII